MAKEEKKEEQGVEATPVLNTGLELQDQKIKALEEKIAKQEKTIAAKEKDNAELQEYVKRLSGINSDLEGKLNDLTSQEKPKKIPGENEVIIRFLLSPAGKFKLPYNVGQEVSLHKEVAAEIVDAKYAEYIK